MAGLGGRKASSSMGKLSSAEVPSATLGTGSSTPRHKRCVRDQSVRRSAQDDDSVGVLTKNILDKLALYGINRPSAVGRKAMPQGLSGYRGERHLFFPRLPQLKPS